MGHHPQTIYHVPCRIGQICFTAQPTASPATSASRSVIQTSNPSIKHQLELYTSADKIFVSTAEEKTIISYFLFDQLFSSWSFLSLFVKAVLF